MPLKDVWDEVFGTFPSANQSALSEDREHRRHERRYWCVSSFISALALIGAGVATWATLRALQVSQQALIATQAALDKAERQAVAAEKALPRAWLYAETPKPLIVTVFYTPGPLPPGKRTFEVKFPFVIHNYGQEPGTITGISAQMLVPNDPVFSIDPPFDLENHPGLGMSENEALLHNMNGDTIGPGSEVKPVLPLTFTFRLQPDIRWHVEMLPKWLHLKINYRDPNGDGRETELLAGVDDEGFKIFNSPLTHWK